MFNAILQFFGSVALFLFGVKLLSEGLESVARGKVKDTMLRLTKNKVSSILFGLILTVILQFSSATIIMTIGMVNSGMINLIQAFGIIMGANIGTTVKLPFLILNPHVLVPFFLISGVILYLYSGKKPHKDLAYVLLGFGLIFIGIRYMGESMVVFKDSAVMNMLLRTIGESWYMGLLTGILVTVLFQSSSATMAVLLSLAGSGAIGLSGAFPVILGANIGTVSTSLISSLGTNRDAKRAAILHLLFNVAGTLLFLPFGNQIVNLIAGFSPNNLGVQLALIHVLFNGLTLVVIYPVMDRLVDFSGRLIPEKKKEVELTNSTVLDRRIINSPSFAEQQMVQQTLRMAEYARENVKLAVDFFLTGDDSVAAKLKSNEDFINYLEVQITSFLIKLSATDLSEKDQGKLAATHHMIADIEKIGDLAENIAELAEAKLLKDIQISDEAVGELRGMYSYVLESMNIAFDAYRNSDKNMASNIFDIEKKINEMEKAYRDTHIARLNKGKCTAQSGILYLDLLSNLERIGDHSLNISESVLKNIVG